MIGAGVAEGTPAEGGRGQDGDRERAEHAGRGPAPVARPDEAQHQPSHREHEQQGADQVGHRRPQVEPHVRDVAEGAEQEQQPDRKIDPECPVPRQLEQTAAQSRSERRRHGSCHGPETHGPRASVRRHRGHKQAEAGRRHRRGTDRLEHPKGDQPPDARREAAGDAGRDEQGHPGDEPALLPDPVRKPAHRNQ
jgi:hypothetical protein